MNYYDILNVKKTSTTHEIKKQYYYLAKIYHPDKSKDSHTKFLEISNAYNTLSSPLKRYKYDIELEFSDIFNKDIKLNLSDSDIVILRHYYSKVRSSTEYRFLKLLFDNLPKNKKKYILLDISKYKYIDLSNLKNFIINIQLSFVDSYINKCKILVINNSYTLFITHTNITYYINYNNHIYTINIITKISENYLIDGYDIYLYNNITLFDFIFNDNITINLPNSSLNITLNTLEPITIPLLGLKNPNNHIRGNLILYNRINLQEKKEYILKNINDYEKNILAKLFT